MSDADVARRIRAVFTMYEFGERMHRSTLRRENPQATDAQIDALRNAWRLDRPGAPHGDAVGRPSRRIQ
ncbi:MAG: hypothetical protein QM582_10710 [Micropruina sp.]|uniref:hypothetical protein n=1 Tax=Micropruina sp. TaxID=2737536 RepID=UPI0039E400FF